MIKSGDFFLHEANYKILATKKIANKKICKF